MVVFEAKDRPKSHESASFPAPEVRGRALQAIAELPVASALGALRPQVFGCLSHPDAGVRIVAARAISRLAVRGDEEVVKTLRSMTRKDPDISGLPLEITLGSTEHSESSLEHAMDVRRFGRSSSMWTPLFILRF